jgi:pyridoxamine 5'-phosphate oxidase
VILAEPSLEQLDHNVWATLERATTDRHHEWRICALGTAGLVGATTTGYVVDTARPTMRMVVLRDLRRQDRTLVFYTDARSDKVAELAENRQAGLLFWNRRNSWQLRMHVEIEVVRSGTEFETRWRQVGATRNAVEYQSALRPGAPLGSAATPDAAAAAPDTVQPEHHFAILRASVLTCDSLELRRDGHRRASFDYVRNTRSWLQP